MPLATVVFNLFNPTSAGDPLSPSDGDLVPQSAQHTTSGAELPISPDLLATPGVLAESPAVRSRALAPIVSHVTRVLGIDRAIAFTVLARGWSAVSGLLTLTLIARFLSPAEQGFYYTFYPLVNLQIIFELGFSVVILQTASHEAAHLRISPEGVVLGPALHHGRLASVLAKAVRWYLVAALMLLAVLIPAGRHFFAAHTRGGAAIHWLAPWILAAVATTITFQIDPIFSFLEGCGQVQQVARARFMQAITGSLLGWTALSLHHGLYAPGAMIAGQGIAGLCFLATRRNLLLPLLRRPLSAPEERISWNTDIWPFQWRMAVSWVCGYFTFQLFTPVLFAHWGPVEAGRMGMSLNIAGALSTVAIAWMNTKASPFGQLIARREFAELDQRFFAALTQSTTINLLGSVAVWMGAQLLVLRHLPLAHRLLSPLPFALLLLGSVANNVVSSEAMYLRAHKQEKFMLNSIVGALYTAPMAWVLGSRFGAPGIATGYFAGTMVIGLGLGTYTFQKYRRRWHDTAGAASASVVPLAH